MSFDDQVPTEALPDPAAQSGPMAEAPSPQDAPQVAEPVAPSYVLLPHHQRMIEDSGISADVALARGYRSVTKKKEVEELGFSKPQWRVPALVHPVHDVHGEVALHQIRPDEPRSSSDGKSIKYETPRNARVAIDVPPGARGSLGDPSKTLFITEGVRKADAAVSRGLCCIALLGVWNWRGKNSMGGLTALADWESIALKGREVSIAFDSDVMTKPAVNLALVRLKTFLERRSANVKLVYLPAGPDGAKVGLDDYFVAGGTVEGLAEHASDEIRKSHSPAGPHCPYEVCGDGLVYMKPTQDGTSPVPLTNFVPFIVADITEDDGAETRHVFEIEARFKGAPVRFRAPAAEFMNMSWVCEHLGCQAVVYAGSSLRDHTRTAIQLLSQQPIVRRVYLHTGWRQHDGAWVYLHAGGAIGANGVVPDVEVKLEGPLARFVLPAPPEGADLVAAVRASVRILDLADLRLTAPVFAAIWRAPLGPCDVTLHMVGPTGQFKTELAALAQRHFGQEMDADHLPGSWLGTANSLEGMAFQAKDALFTIDDFVPANAADAQRLHREAERLIRAKGNSSGRSRMRADTSLRPPKPPRALLLSTGEETPRGQSLRARMLILEVTPGAIDKKKLSACQADATAGLYPAAMAGYLRWLAPRMADMPQRLASEVVRLRDTSDSPGMHRRTPETAANLAVGVNVFLDFAVEIGAITPAERKDLEKKALGGILAAAADQLEHHESNEVTRRFFELLRGAITSGAAHVAAPNGGAPEQPERWGWFRRGDGGDILHQPAAQGRRIGWVDGDDLYLEPEATFAAVQCIGKDGGDALPVSLHTLKRRLRERGFLASFEQRGGKDRLDVRRVLSGQRRSVLHLKTATFFGMDNDADPQPASESDASQANASPSASAETPPSDGARGPDMEEDL